jgi:hypothetical protein
MFIWFRLHFVTFLTLGNNCNSFLTTNHVDPACLSERESQQSDIDHINTCIEKAMHKLAATATSVASFVDKGTDFEGNQRHGIASPNTQMNFIAVL